MKQAHIFITGLVQGVNFRYFVKSMAKKNTVTGWVKNISDGRVEAILQGDTKNIETVLELCKTGPMLSEIEDIQIAWEEGNESYNEFIITTE